MVRAWNKSGGVNTEGFSIISKIYVELFTFHAFNVTIKYSRKLLNHQCFIKRQASVWVVAIVLATDLTVVYTCNGWFG